jgi:hypothetical protein
MPRVNDAVIQVGAEVDLSDYDFVEVASTTQQFDPSPWAYTPGWHFDEKQGGNNCALCTAAALITEKIDDPGYRKTAGIVNGDLQQRLYRVLGERAMNKLWKEQKWFEYQRDDAFVLFRQNERSARALTVGWNVKRDPKLADQIIGLAAYVEWKLNATRDGKPQLRVVYHGFPDVEKDSRSALSFMLSQKDNPKDPKDKTKFAVCTRVKDSGSAHWIYADNRNGKIVFKDFQLDRDGKPEPPASEHPLGPNGIVYTNGLAKYRGGRTELIQMYVLAFGPTVTGSEFKIVKS